MSALTTRRMERLVNRSTIRTARLATQSLGRDSGPFYIISPFTRKGGVYIEHCDHTSQLAFIEEGQVAKGRDVRSDETVPWRRQSMADLVNAFDFKNPDFSVPNLPEVPEPHTNGRGKYDGSSYCASLYGSGRPPVPYD